MGNRGPAQHRYWTPEEDTLLLKLITEMSFGDIVRSGQIPGRSKNAMIGRYRDLPNTEKLDKYRFNNPKHRKPPRARPPQSPIRAETKVSVEALNRPKTQGTAATELPTGMYEPSNPVSFVDLPNNGCRYPIGNLFCGDPQVFKTSYCEAHNMMCVQVGSKSLSKKLINWHSFGD